MVTVTNAHRIVFPVTGHTKGDVVDYYRRSAARVLAHVTDRPLTLKRFPKGVQGGGFFQKNVPPHYPASMARIEIPRKGGVTIHPCAGEPEHLAFLANQGVIELHVPTARSGNLYHPDRFIIDLDPPEGEVTLVRAAAQLMRSELEALGLPAALVATGSKGYHLVAPIAPTLGAFEAARMGQGIAALAARRHERELTTTFRVAQRGRRVFIDWLRNGVPATVIAPFSLRGRPSPTIAVPIEWEELEEIAPHTFDLGNIEARLDSEDPLTRLAATRTDARPIAERVRAEVADEKIVLEGFDRFRS